MYYRMQMDLTRRVAMYEPDWYDVREKYTDEATIRLAIDSAKEVCPSHPMLVQLNHLLEEKYGDVPRPTMDTLNNTLIGK